MEKEKEEGVSLETLELLGGIMRTKMVNEVLNNLVDPF